MYERATPLRPLESSRECAELSLHALVCAEVQGGRGERPKRRWAYAAVERADTSLSGVIYIWGASQERYVRSALSAELWVVPGRREQAPERRGKLARVLLPQHLCRVQRVQQTYAAEGFG